MQGQLEHAKQKGGETSLAYIRRYRAEATRGYSEERPTSEERRVVASFFRGFADRTFAERLFRTGKVTTLTEAISTALEKEAERESLEQVLQIKGQETMEVDVVNKTTVSEEAKMTSMMETIQRRLEQLNSCLTKVEASRNQQSPPKSPRAGVNSTVNRLSRLRTSEPDRRQSMQCNCLHQWTPDGRPICGFCRQLGHFYRECRRRLPGTAARLTPSGAPEVADLSGCRKSIQLAIAGIQINALIDTGAARSLMADSVFQDIRTRTNSSSLLRPSGVICGLGGKPLDVIGETELLITDAGPVNVMMTRGLLHQLLLGSDAVAAGHGMVFWTRKT